MTSSPIAISLSAPVMPDDPLNDDITEWLDVLPSHAGPQAPGTLRKRLLGRVHQASQASRLLTTLRRHQMVATQPAPGVSLQTLYESATPKLRPGEPLRCFVVALHAGASWALPAVQSMQRECLVTEGELQIDGQALAARDYLRGSGQALLLHSPAGARLYVRETPVSANAPAQAIVQRDAAEHWQSFAPGIQRRVMWTDG